MDNDFSLSEFSKRLTSLEAKVTTMERRSPNFDTNKWGSDINKKIEELEAKVKELEGNNESLTKQIYPLMLLKEDWYKSKPSAAEKECKHPLVGGLVGKPKACMYCGKPVSEFSSPAVEEKSLVEKINEAYYSNITPFGIVKIAEAHYREKFDKCCNKYRYNGMMVAEDLRQELFGQKDT